MSSRQRGNKDSHKESGSSSSSGSSRDGHRQNVQKGSTETKRVDETHTTSSSSSSLPIPWFVIVAINILFILLFIAFVIYCFHKRKKRRQALLKNSITPPHSPYYSSSQKNINLQSSMESVRAAASALRAKNSIFTIEENAGKTPAFLNNGERVFEKNSRASFVELNMEKKIEDVAPERPKKSSGRFRALGRLISGFKYNPAASPSVKQFEQNNAETFPNNPAVYEPPKQEALQTSVYHSEAESKSGADLSKDETDEDVSDIADTEKKHKIDRNGDSGFGEQIVTTIAKPNLAKIQGSSEEDSEKEVLKTISKTPVAELLPPTPPKDGRASAAVQTTPISWLNIPGAIDLTASDDFHNYLLSEANDRKYFIYLVTDSNPYFRKDCIGRISLPMTGKITLSELRDHLMKADDENLRRLMKKHSQFRFLTETYRFVAQNEAIAPIDDVYPTNGIFIKINAADLAHTGGPVGLNIANRGNPSAVINETVTATNAPLTGRGALAMPHVASRIHNRNAQHQPIVPSFISVQAPSRRPSRMFEEDDHAIDSRRDAMNRRHIDCVSPHPIQRKLRIRRRNLLFTELKKYCDNPTCTSSKRSILKCGKCNVTCYCTPECKREHWNEHKITCTKPPWRL